MIVSINNVIQSNWIFISIFLIIFLFSLGRKKIEEGFSISITQELKGFAILAIIFSHIGYFLVDDHRFLFPLTIAAGVGVDLFLILSGYGLTISKLKKDETIFQFYKKRVLKLMIPFWLVLSTFLIMDFLILKISYSWAFIGKAFLGIFTSANIYNDLNSPFWYFTLILFFYVLYPIVFSKKHIWITSFSLFILAFVVTNLNLPILSGVSGLQKSHIIAFPLGILIAWFANQNNSKIKLFFHNFIEKMKHSSILFKKIFYYSFMILLISFISYFAYHSGVGKGIILEQLTSIVTTIAILILFFFKKIESKLLYIFGIYSYELYLLHWPIMYRYDIFYKNFPGWFATILYLVLFMGIGFILKNISEKIVKYFKI